MEIIYQLHPNVNKLINMVTLIPYLNSYSLLTTEERSYLNNSSVCATEKVTYFLQSLESKGDIGMKNFLQALKEASKHSGHEELCRLLSKRGVEI